MEARDILQIISGRDLHLAADASPSEQRMFNALGLLILAITSLTFLSGFYGVYLIIQPKDHSSIGTSALAFFITAIIAMIWAMIVFNYYRLSLSTISISKHSFSIEHFVRLSIQIFFGLILGFAISAPIAVSISHEELRSSALPEQHLMIGKIQNSIDRANRESLDALYHSKVQAQIKLRKIQDYKKISSKTDNPTESELQMAESDLTAIDNKISSLRSQLVDQKSSIQEIITANDGLITNLQKALYQNKYLVFLITLFVAIIMTLPSILIAHYIPGIYEYLIEYTNHVNLAGKGIIPNQATIFVDSNASPVTRFTSAEVMLHEKIYELKHLTNQDIEKS